MTTTRSLYGEMILDLESKIFQKRLELQQLNKKQEMAEPLILSCS